jgi:NADP-dependent 3-hydroxy acid dehydrogenase YdfG
VTCGSDEKRQLLIDLFGCPEDHILSSRDNSFGPAIKTATCGKGIDVVLNSLRGAPLETSWECLAPFGRFIEIGRVDIEASRRLDLSPFARGVAFMAMDLVHYHAVKGEVVHRALVNSMRILRSRSSETKPTSPVFPIATYPVEDLRRAIMHMRIGKQTGKVVIVPQPDSLVRVEPRVPAPVCLDGPGSTYLVVGLGGLGYAITSWMTTIAGAKNVMVVSRHAESHARTLALQQEAALRSSTVHTRNCNMADPEAVRALLADVANSSTIPPIDGVVHVAGVLNDSIFERMSHDQWNATVQPKVAGTWTLHEGLPDVHFFVMVSSLTGIMGNQSQANYVAGNTFHDALARHRTSRRQAEVTIDLGPVDEAGYLAETTDEIRYRTEKSLGMEFVPVSYVLQLVEDAIRHPRRQSPDDSQVVTCLAQHSALPEEPGLRNDNRLGTLRVGDVTGATHEAKAGNTTNTDSSARELDQFLAEFVDACASPSSHNDRQAYRQRIELSATKLIAAKVADFFNTTVADVNCSLSLPAHGVDSLVAVDFRNWLSSVLQAKVSMFDILQSPSITHLAGVVAGSSRVRSED